MIGTVVYIDLNDDFMNEVDEILSILTVILQPQSVTFSM
jgi:hypothetical protein